MANWEDTGDSGKRSGSAVAARARSREEALSTVRAGVVTGTAEGAGARDLLLDAIDSVSYVQIEDQVCSTFQNHILKLRSEHPPNSAAATSPLHQQQSARLRDQIQ